MSNNFQDFLKLCASDVLSKRKSDLQNTTIVFPNKRPILFFKRNIANEIQNPIFLPKFITIQDLYSEINNSIIPENIILVYELFAIYKKHLNSTESFDNFYPWGEMLIKDFDDIDKYLIDYKHIFSNIASIKEYEDSFSFLSNEQVEMLQRFWNVIDKNDSSEVKQKFLEVWNKLSLIYSDFKEKLSSLNYAYSGMSARNAIEKLQKHEEAFPKNQHYIFVGFNALNECEKKLFSHLKPQASFYWDYDNSYLNTDFNHEAGYFIKKNKADFGNELDDSCYNNFEKQKQTTIISVPNNIAQIKQVESWISKLSKEDISSSNSAIILADEQLLVPLIYSIPNNIPYNISLGYPLKNTSSYAFFTALLNLQQGQKNGAFYHKNIVQICESSLLTHTQKEDAQKLCSIINKKNMTYVSEKFLQGDFSVKSFFRVAKSPTDFIYYLEQIVSTVGEYEHINDIEKSVLYAIYQEIQRLKLLISEHNINIESISFISSLLKKSLLSKNIPIQGEPLQGIQIMGILETRTLDFKNLLILSMNEGLFPRTNVGSSFIPYSLRTGYGMPTIKEQTSIYSYYFYRLLQRAQNVTLSYSVQVDENSKGEVSRYIMQLKYDSPKAFSNITEKNISFSITPQSEHSISVKKEQETIERFKEYTEERPFSPSALDCYIRCSLQFYYKYVRKLKPLDEIKEMPDEADFGNFFHLTLEDLYKKFIGKEIKKQDIQAILNDSDLLEKTIEKNILAALKEDKNTTANDGNKKLAQSTITTYIKNTLSFDLQKAPFTISGLEKDVKMPLTIQENTVWIGGNIDRLENDKGLYRIIDYKTGTKKDAPKSLEDLFDTKNDKRNNAILQALFYSYIISEKYKTNPQAQLYYTRNLHLSNDANIKIDKNVVENFSDVKDEYVELLTDKLNELFDLNIPFEQTSQNKTCEYCDYADICRK